MAPLPDYVSGTITLTNGSAAFTGSGTGWLAASFREGDTILGIEDNPGVTYVIESITDNDAGTLTQPWDGPSGTYEYRMRYLSDGQRVTAQARQLIELLGNGNLQALAGLSGTPNTLPMFTGTGAMIEVPRTDLVSGANYDVQVATLPDRDAYDGQSVGFAVLVSDTGDGRAAIFSRVEGGGWSGAAYVTGPSITLDVTEVDEVPYGAPPDVTLTPRTGGYDLAFDIPRGMVIEPGATTTLAPDQDAEVTFVPVTGGYRLDIAIPRGPTGDIDGVTPFWQDRITTDVDAAAARAGLGAQVAGDYEPEQTPVTQAEAESGTETSVKSWSPLRVSQAIASLAPEVPPDVYRRANILDPVAQVGGVPTGGIIERGENANGEYVRYADGTQICSYFWDGVAITAGNNNTFEWDYPAVFATGLGREVTRIGSPLTLNPPSFHPICFNGEVEDSTQVAVTRTGSFTSAFFYGFAIGRWF